MEFAEGRIIKTASRDRQMSVASDDWEEVGGEGDRMRRGGVAG